MPLPDEPRAMRDHDRPGEERQAGSPAWAPPDEATLRSLIDQVPVTVYIDRLDDGDWKTTQKIARKRGWGKPGNQWLPGVDDLDA